MRHHRMALCPRPRRWGPEQCACLTQALGLASSVSCTVHELYESPGLLQQLCSGVGGLLLHTRHELETRESSAVIFIFILD